MTDHHDTAGATANDLTPLVTTWKADKQYFKYVCANCGCDAQNTYCEPSYTQMMDRRLCFTCAGMGYIECQEGK